MAAAHPQTARDPWAAHYATAAGYRWWPTEELVRSVARFATQTPRMFDALEVGCGNGANLWFLAEQIHRVTGLDFSATALSAARAHMAQRAPAAGRRVTLVQADLRRGVPCRDQSFDLVVDCMTSQHVPWGAHETLYREYARVLRPQGRVFLYHLTDRTSGAVTGTWNYHDGIALFPSAGFICLPDRRALDRALVAAGLVTSARGVAREYTDGATAHYAVIEARRTW